MKSSSILHSVRTSFFCLAGNIPEGLFWHQFSPQVIFPMWDFFFERCLKGILFCPIKHLHVQFFDIICRKYTFLPFKKTLMLWDISSLKKVFLWQFYFAKRPLKSYKMCNIFFEHGFDPPPPPPPPPLVHNEDHFRD